MNYNISIPNAGIAALLGYAVVFVGLVLLMAVVILMGKAMTAKKVSKAPTAPATDTPATKQSPVAPGSAGEIKLYDVPDKEAAMLMAIVAEQMGKPLNELRFKSIKEVK